VRVLVVFVNCFGQNRLLGVRAVKISENRPPAGPAAAPVNLSKTPPLKKAEDGGLEAAASNRLKAPIPAQAGILKDRLSVSILSFARFFSLPLDGGLAAKIRRMALQAKQPKETGPEQPGRRPAEPRSEAGKHGAGRAAPENQVSRGVLSQNFREALSLAALAAEHKGVELSPRALAEYAAALDPAESADPDAGGGPEGGADRESGGGSGAEAGTGEGGRPEAEAGGFRGNPAGLKLKIQETMKKSPLLTLLNSIPGKDGRRWIVLPFSFSSKGILYKVSMRILLCPLVSKTAVERLALDIVRFDQAENKAKAHSDREDSTGGKTENRRLFIVDKGNPSRLDFRLKPFPEKRRVHTLSRKLSELLKIPGEHIFIRNFEDSFDFMADSRINVLPSVNEDV
jgi:hypothetical protein